MRLCDNIFDDVFVYQLSAEKQGFGLLKRN